MFQARSQADVGVVFVMVKFLCNKSIWRRRRQTAARNINHQTFSLLRISVELKNGSNRCGYDSNVIMMSPAEECNHTHLSCGCTSSPYSHCVKHLAPRGENNTNSTKTTESLQTFITSRRCSFLWSDTDWWLFYGCTCRDWNQHPPVGS